MGTGQRRERGSCDVGNEKNRGIERGERDAEKKMCSRSEPGFLIRRHHDRPHMQMAPASGTQECAKCLPSEYQPRTEADTVAALTFAVSHLDVGLGLCGCQGEILIMEHVEMDVESNSVF
ncbi:hypothetical protein MCOR25_001509 [Pyricularia grisea]|uniref:Uncharacterized protein n=1 Tax=Pyricularia grisea TaxID=148305 RepID=A0A6P8AWT3_PYRGI|nr:uncharacterized protein PgNI_09047 [Pyricularia grisea]KAI6380839.1 hypothetical protein MCOR25_001509 [Pyricularia grisea]TLD06683.1 hypothetical protein PgNI_09047 [Pyricularia grisea]